MEDGVQTSNYTNVHISIHSPPPPPPPNTQTYVGVRRCTQAAARALSESSGMKKADDA